MVLIDVFKNEAALTTPFIRNFFCFVGIVELPWDGLHITLSGVGVFGILLSQANIFTC